MQAQNAYTFFNVHSFKIQHIQPPPPPPPPLVYQGNGTEEKVSEAKNVLKED